MHDLRLRVEADSIWEIPKPETIYLVGRNQFRMSRLSRMGNQWDIEIKNIDLGEDPISPFGLNPAHIAVEKVLAVTEDLINKQPGSCYSAILAVDALNGFIVSRNGELVVEYKGKPKSWDEIRANFALLAPVKNGQAVIQLEVANAIHWLDYPDLSFSASRIHRGYISSEKLEFIQSDKGFGEYRERALKYRLINPLYFAGGISWPILFAMGIFDQIDNQPVRGSKDSLKLKGEVITHATSFDSKLVELMLRYGYKGVIGNDKLLFSDYINIIRDDYYQER